MFNTFCRIFIRPIYILLAFVTTAISFAFSVWLPNLGLLWSFLISNASLGEKFSLMISLLESIGTNFTILSAILTISIAILFGLYVAIIVYFIVQHRTISGNQVITGAGGFVGGLFGIGCAACGSFLFTSLFGLTGASIIIAFLPLGGAEFSILGIVLMLIAIAITLKRIKTPFICITTSDTVNTINHN